MPNESNFVEKYKTLIVVLVVVVVLIALLYYVNKFFGGIGNVFRKITDSLGITDSAETAANKAALDQAKNDAANPGSPWSPTFFQNAPSGTDIFTTSYADTLCEQVWDSVSAILRIFNNIEEAYGAIKNCKNQAQVSFLCYRFNEKYGLDMWSWLNKEFGTFAFNQNATLQTINEFVTNLPKYSK